MRPRNDVDATRRVPICVALLNWNAHRHTIECLESLFMSDPMPAATVLVDNGSTDGSLAALTAWAARSGIAHRVVSEFPAEWPAVRDLASDGLVIIPSSTNRGYASGKNLALAY